MRQALPAEMRMWRGAGHTRPRARASAPKGVRPPCECRHRDDTATRHPKRFAPHVRKLRRGRSLPERPRGRGGDHRAPRSPPCGTRTGLRMGQGRRGAGDCPRQRADGRAAGFPSAERPRAQWSRPLPRRQWDADPRHGGACPLLRGAPRSNGRPRCPRRGPFGMRDRPADERGRVARSAGAARHAGPDL